MGTRKFKRQIAKNPEDGEFFKMLRRIVEEDRIEHPEEYSDTSVEEWMDLIIDEQIREAGEKGMSQKEIFRQLRGKLPADFVKRAEGRAKALSDEVVKEMSRFDEEQRSKGRMFIGITRNGDGDGYILKDYLTPVLKKIQKRVADDPQGFSDPKRAMDDAVQWGLKQLPTPEQADADFQKERN